MLKRIHILRGVSEALLPLARASHTRTFEKGVSVFEAGDPSGSMFFVAAGTLHAEMMVRVEQENHGRSPGCARLRAAMRLGARRHTVDSATAAASDGEDLANRKGRGKRGAEAKSAPGSAAGARVGAAAGRDLLRKVRAKRGAEVAGSSRPHG